MRMSSITALCSQEGSWNVVISGPAASFGHFEAPSSAKRRDRCGTCGRWRETATSPESRRRNLMTALADPARRREHDKPRDERGHARIQQDFIENFNHRTLHTRLCLRAAL